MKKRTVAVAALALIAFAGCLKNDGSVSTPRVGIMVDLLSPNATNTTIGLNGNTYGSNMSYGNLLQYYTQVNAGTTNVTVTTNQPATLLNTSFVTDAGYYYSVFLVDSASRMKAIVVKDSVNYPNNTDSVKVRFYNFAPNSPALSVVLTDTSHASTHLNNRAFETQQTATAYNTFMPMKAGTYTCQIFAPGSDQSLKDTSVTFDGKHIYTLFIKGFYPDTSGSTAIGLGTIKHG